MLTHKVKSLLFGVFVGVLAILAMCAKIDLPQSNVSNNIVRL
jgi:hypothetical protein